MNDENNFTHKLVLTNTWVLRLRKAFANKSSANIKLSKTHSHRIEQSGEFVGTFLERLTGLPLKKHVLKLVAKSVLTALGSAASVADAAIHKKMLRSGYLQVLGT